MNLLVIIILIALSIATFQFAIMKNDLDSKWNDKFGPRFGNYCFLCVGFWLGILLTIFFGWRLEMSWFQIVVCILATPSLTMLIIKPYFNK